MALFMFLRLGNKTILQRRLPNVSISCDLQMACVNCKFIGAIFESNPHVGQSPDLENIGIVV